jgi:hypothetical protein
MTIPQSSDSKILQFLRENNPFEGHSITKSHHIWDDDFLDVPSINEHVSAEIFDAIELVRRNNATLGIVVVAPKGSGKTHLLSRVRHKLGQEGQGCFIYICEYGNLSSMRNQWLQSIAVSLKKPGASGATQWQELATALINKATNKDYKPSNIVTNFPKILAQYANVVDHFTNKIIQTFEIDDPYIARAIVWTLSRIHAPFAIRWLAGGELSENQSKVLGLPETDMDDIAAQAFAVARQILNLVAEVTIPVICFDELDGAESVSEDDEDLAGFTRAMAVASLEKDIFNGLKRGVFLTSTYANTYQKQLIDNLGLFIGVTDRIAAKRLDLKPLNSDTTVDLVRHWLNHFYQRHRIIAPHPLYPFEESQLRKFGGEFPTAREILQRCAKDLATEPVNPMEKLEKAYQDASVRIEDFEEDNQLIGQSLAHALKYLCGRTIEGVKIVAIDTKVKPYSRHKGTINFKITGEENGTTVKIGVAVIQHAHGKSVGSVIKYLNDLKAFGLTRGCMVRQKSLAAHWSIANQQSKILCEEQGGEWVTFKNEEILPLIALYRMADLVGLEEFSKEEFQQFIEEKCLVESNPVIREILSNPSGQVPTDVIREDLGLDLLLEQSVAVDSNIDAALELNLVM